MLTPAGQYRVFAHTKALDFRCGMDRIAHICKAELAMNPYGGAVFLFFNRRRDRAKIFFYDGTGACLFLKRLDFGRFQLPRVEPGASHAMIPATDLALLLEGVDVGNIKRPKGPSTSATKARKNEKHQAVANTTTVAP